MLDRLLVETGFKSFRIEIGWGEMNWDETKLRDEELFLRRLGLCQKYGIRPTLLINAHQGVPCPTRFFERQLPKPATKGQRTIQFDTMDGLVIRRSGLSGLSDYWAAEALVTAVNPDTREITLSKPLAKDLPAGKVQMATLKYAPLHPVDTREFDETAAAWARHALHVCQLADAAGLSQFDLEVWNELTFGSHFLNINDYYDKGTPKITVPQPDFLNPGGRCWELARRTVEAVKKSHPAARIIWGFCTVSASSNEQAEVVASISQELRQPMSSVVGYTDLLLGESVGILGALISASLSSASKHPLTALEV